MRRFLKVLAILIGVIVLAIVLLYLLIPREKLMAMAAPKIDNIRVTDVRIGEEQATMFVLLDVSSKFIPVVLDSVKYDFQLYGQSVAHGEKNLEKTKNNGNKQTIKLPVSMNHNKTRELVRRQVREDEPVRAKIKAYCDLPLFGKEQIDIDKEVDMLIPALPGMEVTDLRIEDFGLDNMKMVMTMQIDNPNKFDYYIREMKMDLQLKDYMHTIGGTSKDLLIKAQQKTSIEVPATSDLQKPLKTTFKTLTGDHVWPYTMKSYMVLEPKSKVVGTVHMDAVKTGKVNVVQQVKKIIKNNKAEKKAEKEAKKD